MSSSHIVGRVAGRRSESSMRSARPPSAAGRATTTITSPTHPPRPVAVRHPVRKMHTSIEGRSPQLRQSERPAVSRTYTGPRRERRFSRRVRSVVVGQDGGAFPSTMSSPAAALTPPRAIRGARPPPTLRTSEARRRPETGDGPRVPRPSSLVRHLPLVYRASILLDVVVGASTRPRDPPPRRRRLRHRRRPTGRVASASHAHRDRRQTTPSSSSKSSPPLVSGRHDDKYVFSPPSLRQVIPPMCTTADGAIFHTRPPPPLSSSSLHVGVGDTDARCCVVTARIALGGN